jgi:hypothetical protein
MDEENKDVTVPSLEEEGPTVTVQSLIDEGRVGVVTVPMSAQRDTPLDLLLKIGLVMFVTDIQYNIASQQMIMMGVSTHFEPRAAEGTVIPMYKIVVDMEKRLVNVVKVEDGPAAEDS